MSLKIKPGPWTNEPNEVKWTDAVTGYDCLILRQDMGHLCGYVRVPESHPNFQSSYDDVDVRVHGGLTFAGEPFSKAGGYWFGFDCAHAFDLIPALPIPVLSGEYRNVEYVRQEVLSLAKQLKGLENATSQA